MDFQKKIQKAVRTIRKKAAGFKPEVGLILGSGLGGFTDILTEKIKIPYNKIPYFPVSAVKGHAGKIIFGKLSYFSVICLQGRVHLYEGIQADQIKLLIRIFKALGCYTLIITNSSGSLNKSIKTGDVVLIRDHINFTGTNPLVGPNDELFGPRFVSMENAYDESLRQLMKQAAKSEEIPIHEGVYLSTLGPSYETPAEIQAFQKLDADIVGMSTIPEVIVARHAGLKVVALSMVASLASGMDKEPLTHEKVLKQAKINTPKLISLLIEFFKLFSDYSYQKMLQTVDTSPWYLDSKKTAKQIISLIDLTSLSMDDRPEDIHSLCKKAQTPYGKVAAVCILPLYIKTAKTFLKNTSIKIATVVNFPRPDKSIDEIVSTIKQAIKEGADEIDVVFPYEAFLNNDEVFTKEFIKFCKKACGKHVLLKVILETGKLQNAETIYRASCLAIDAGANFIKTSTGLSEINATPIAAMAMLSAIKQKKAKIGLKIAGGIHNMKQAVEYLAIAELIMGKKWITKSNFRFGASHLLENILDVIENKDRKEVSLFRFLKKRNKNSLPIFWEKKK